MGFPKVHVSYLTLIAVACLASYLVFTSWREEHDARLVSEVKVHAAEDLVKSLQQQIQDRDAASAQQIALLKKQAAAVTTPPQAIAAIPQISNVPLNARVLPDSPTQVGVDALPLFQELSACRQQSVTLGTCQADLKDSQAVIAQKDVEIVALKKKPGFWKTVTSHGKVGVAFIVVFEIVKIALTKQP
jgi:hypothetical protein